MGNNRSVFTPNNQPQLLVRTGDQKGKGTDANVYVILYGRNKRKSKTIPLECSFRDNFERGQTDNFPVSLIAEDGKPLGRVQQIELWRDDTGLGSDWFCDLIILLDLGEGASIPFPVQRWIRPNYCYRIEAYDTSLPQDDPNPIQRKQELDYKRTVYRFSGKDPHLPGLMAECPSDEEYSDDYTRALVAETIKYELVGLVGRTLSGDWKKLQDVEKAFMFPSIFPLPEVHKRWKTDEWFGAQRLVGANPMSIQLCTEIPDTFNVTDDTVRAHLEGLDLQQAINDKKIFIEDLTFLDGVPTVDECKLTAPLGLFYLNKQSVLKPIAIQLYPGKDHPVFTPADDENVWVAAKLWFNLADSNYHQSWVHLGATHLIMEAIALASHRNLAPDHPVFKLLAHHFLYIMAINQSAFNRLVNRGGLLDKTCTVGGVGALEIVRRSWKTWRMNIEGTFPKHLEERGVLDKDVLPVYPYRDDGLLLYNAIKTYVTKIINYFYAEDERKISSDEELQNWIKELSTPALSAGSGIKGLPNDGNITTIDDVIPICTNIIFTCTAQHAAINFCQYDVYAFAPNYPFRLSGKPPKDKTPLTDEQLVDFMPPKICIYKSLFLFKILSEGKLNSLGDWDLRYQFEPNVLRIENEFRQELLDIATIIEERNKLRDELYYYKYLHPSEIPNSISV